MSQSPGNAEIPDALDKVSADAAPPAAANPDPPPETIEPLPPPQGGDVIQRHAISTRLWHWTNALTLFVMLLSGLMIFNAHPRLYWGQYGANFDKPWFEIGSHGNDGFVRLG